MSNLSLSNPTKYRMTAAQASHCETLADRDLAQQPSSDDQRACSALSTEQTLYNISTDNSPSHEPGEQPNNLTSTQQEDGMAPCAPYITVDGVHVSYDGQTDALCDITLEICRGEYLCVLGRNGSGKSTLARSINALIQPDQGSVLVDGLNASYEDDIIPIRRRVGMVFQNPDDQMVTAVVEDDVAFGPENLGVPREEIIVRVDEALEVVGMSNHRYTDPSDLSGGQKQRIAIAGVLAMLPDALIFDESCAMLDPLGRKEILAKMRDLHAQGYTIIHITHDMDDVLEAQRVVVVEKGAIIFDGTPALLFSSPAQVLGLGLDIPYSLAISQRLVKRGLIDGLVARRQDLTAQILEALCQ